MKSKLTIVVAVYVLFFAVSESLCADKSKKKYNVEKSTEVVKEKPRNIYDDIAVLNLSKGDFAGRETTRAQLRDFERAMGLVRSRKMLGEALSLLEGLRVNVEEIKGPADSAVSIVTGRAYFCRGEYSLALKYAHIAAQSSEDFHALRAKAAFLAGISYIKMGDKAKAKHMLSAATGLRVYDSPSADMADIYLNELGENKEEKKKSEMEQGTDED